MKRPITFVELLIVVVIIAVVCAVLYPTFAQTKNGDPVYKRCVSHLKQLGTAFMLYLPDNDETYPTWKDAKTKIVGRPPEAEGPRQEWFVLIKPYLRNQSALRCPSDKSPETIPTSYTLNAWAEYDLKETEIVRPEKWVLMGERNNEARANDPRFVFQWWTWQGADVWPPIANPIPTVEASRDIAFDRNKPRPDSNWLVTATSSPPP